MVVKITARKMPVTDALRAYAEEKIGNSMKVVDVNPLEADVVLHVEKNPANPSPATCEVTIFAKGNVIRVEESEEDMYSAIDVAAAKILRQLRKFKTKVINRKTKVTPLKSMPETCEQISLDDLMDELSQDDLIVRVKEIEFLPLTEEEALVQVDLLGHDFFAYTDRDSSMTHIIYRRNDGGYGIIKQTG